MSTAETTAKNETPKAKSDSSDTVKVRVKTQLLVERRFSSDDVAKREIVSERYAQPGEIIELPRKEAEKLAGRNFEGYPTSRDTKWATDQQGNVTSCGGATCGPYPNMNGRVSDGVVELLP